MYFAALDVMEKNQKRPKCSPPSFLTMLDPRSLNLSPLHWELLVLTTGPPGKSLDAQ